MQLAADFANLLILDNRPHEEIKHSERGYMGKIKFKRRKFQSTLARNQTIEETLHKLTNIQNEKLDKLTKITQNLENKLNGIQQKMGDYENKLNQLEEEKEQLRNEMVPKTNLIVFQLDRQEQYIRRENILIYGIEKDKEDDDDGEKVLFKIAVELEIDLQVNEIQRVHRLGQKRRNKDDPSRNIARFVPYEKRNEFLTNKRDLKNIEGRLHL